MPNMRIFTVLLLCVATLTACDRYRVTLNELAVYDPPPLFSDFHIADHALFLCVQQTIEDQRVAAAAQLKQLNCSHAGITSLQGLERFDQLQALNVRDNAITDVDTLRQLPQLRMLDIAGNRLTRVTALLALPNMETVDLQDNPGLDCKEGLAITKAIAKTVLPDHCR